MAVSDDLQGFRLILSDSLAGGQRVKTFNKAPANAGEVVALLIEHFDFQKLCEQRGFGKTPAVGAGVRLQGFDGPRRVPIQDTQGLVAFLADLQNTRLPSIEVRLAPAGPNQLTPIAAPAVPAKASLGKSVLEAETRRRGETPPQQSQDRVEQLEEENFRLNRASERVERRLAEMERLLASSKEENQRIIDVAQREMHVKQEKVLTDLQAQLSALQQSGSEQYREFEIVRDRTARMDEKGGQHIEELTSRLAELSKRLDGQLLEVHRELEARKGETKRLDQECLTIKRECKSDFASYRDEIDRLEQMKVGKEDWRKHEKLFADSAAQETAAVAHNLEQAVTSLTERISKDERETKERLDEVRRVSSSSVAELSKSINDHLGHVDEALVQLNSDVQAGLKGASMKIQSARTELQTDLEEKVASVLAKLDKEIAETRSDVTSKDSVLTHRLDDLAAKTDTDAQGLSERIEELSRVERARLGAMERELAETATKIRSDCRSEMERVRTDYEQEAARLDTDLADLHMKHDVTKQEINFVQSRLQEQREWAQRELAAAATATRAAVVDAQEAHSATTKMLHALRDDTVAFREKMAKYISLLQHSSDSQGDAINLLETQRARLRSDLEVLVTEHKAYTSDMDSWADDVRVKVERLFRAMEPARAEWRVARAQVRAKELKRPLAVKSPSFALRGLRDVKMEFYPDGHSNSPDGKAVLRVMMPATARVRYQCWFGRASDGPKEFAPSSQTDNFADVYVEQWKEHIQEDGTLSIAFEVLRDHENDDELLSREVRLESK